MDNLNKNPSETTANPDSPAIAATVTPGPLVLKRGTRIQLGYRTGAVEDVRGGWVKPYEVRVRWDGEKYPQYIVFRTLELDHEKGRLKVL